MIKTDHSYEEKSHLDYDKLVGETALISTYKGQCALLNVKTNQLIMPWGEESIDYDPTRNWFSRTIKVDGKEYLYIYSPSRRKMLVNGYKVLTKETGSFLGILQNPKTGKMRFYREGELGSSTDIFKHEFTDIYYLRMINGFNYYAVSNGSKYALYTEEHGVLGDYEYKDIEYVPYTERLLIFRRDNEEILKYGPELIGEYNSINYVNTNIAGITLVMCRKDNAIDVYYVSPYTFRKAFTVKGRELTFLNYNDKAASKYVNDSCSKALFLFGLLDNKSNKLTINKVVLSIRGEALTPFTRATKERFDQILTKGTKGDYVTLVERDGKQGQYRDAVEPEVVPPKYDKLVQLFNGRYCLGYNKGKCDIVSGKTGSVLEEDVRAYNNGKSVYYKTKDYEAVFDENGCSEPYEKIEKTIGNFYIYHDDGFEGLLRGHTTMTTPIYCSHGAIINTNTDTVIYTFKKEDGTIDVIRTKNDKVDFLNSFTVTDVESEGEIIVLKGPNRTVIRSMEGGIIKVFQREVPVNISRLHNSDENKPDYYISADGLDYEYNLKTNKLEAVPMETTVVYSKEYVGEYGTVFIQSLKKDEFDEGCALVESMSDEEFEWLMRKAFISDTSVLNNPRYKGLKRRLSNGTNNHNI